MYYDGVGIPVEECRANQAPETWQHHRFIIDPNALTFTLYIDDMDNAVISNATWPARMGRADAAGHPE